MLLGWYDPDKKKPAKQKVKDACDRYKEKFGVSAVSVLTSLTDAEELVALGSALDVRGVYYIPRFTYYVGIEDTP